MFKGCDELKINILNKDLALYINHETHWIYACLDMNLRSLQADFMNELTVTLMKERHIVVKNFVLHPGRIEANLKEILCISFEHDHEAAGDLVASAAHETARSVALASPGDCFIGQ